MIRIAMLALGLVAVATVARADLGDTLSEARGRSYAADFGALLPLFATDSLGRVEQECWQAPPAMWSQAQALVMAQRMAGAGGPPVPQGRDGATAHYGWPDGKSVIMIMFGDRAVSVEVRAAGFDGIQC